MPIVCIVCLTFTRDVVIVNGTAIVITNSGPGQYGRPAVCVPAPSCVIKFHAEDRNPDWGYRITARAKCKESTEPPERWDIKHLGWRSGFPQEHTSEIWETLQ